MPLSRDRLFGMLANSFTMALRRNSGSLTARVGVRPLYSLVNNRINTS